MVIPNGVDIPMPHPYGGAAPIINRTANQGEGAKGDTITVQFVGEIGPVSQYLELINVLDTATEDDHIVFQIDSPGGDVYTAQLLVDRMESCKAKVTTVASGLVASAATFIWFYGQEKEVGRWARFMFHSSLHGDWGKSLAIKENATELVNYMKSILTDQQTAGVLLGLELAKILKDKANVELSGATVQARLKALKAEGDENGEPEEGAGEEEGQEGTEGGEGGETATPEAKKGKKKAKKRRAEGEEGTEENGAGAGEGEGAEGGEEGGEEGAGEGEEAEPGLDIEAIFKAEGIEQEPVQTPENQPAEGGEETTEEEAAEGEPGTPEAKCGKKSKKGKKRRAEGEDAGEGEGEGEEEITPDGDDGEEEGSEGAEGGEGEGAEAPAAKCGKKGGKKISKKRRAEDVSSDVTVGEEPESAKPEQTSEIVPGSEGDGGSEEAGATDGETNAAKTAAFDIDAIFAEEGVVTPDEGEGDAGEGEDGDDGDEGEEEEGEEGEPGEGDGAPAAKCGKGKKKAKPSKKRKGEGDPAKTDPDTTVIEPKEPLPDVTIQKDAPTSRYW